MAKFGNSLRGSMESDEIVPPPKADEEHSDTVDPRQWLPEGEEVLTEARKQRRDTVKTTGERGGVEYRSFDRPLAFYVLRGHITGEQFMAGERFEKLRHYSILRERYVLMRYGEMGGDSDPENHALAPMQYLEATKAIRGELELKFVIAVCCDGKTVGKRGGMGYLRAGLDDLVTHFKVKRR